MDEITAIVLAAKICSEVHVIIGTYIGNLYNNIYQFVMGTVDTNEVIVYKDDLEVPFMPSINLVFVTRIFYVYDFLLACNSKIHRDFSICFLMQLAKTAIPGFVNCSKTSYFWVSWESGVLMLGEGQTLFKNLIIETTVGVLDYTNFF